MIKSLLAQPDGRFEVTSNTPKGVVIQLDVPLEANAGGTVVDCTTARSILSVAGTVGTFTIS